MLEKFRTKDTRIQNVKLTYDSDKAQPQDGQETG